jgi:hypothetical protein
LEKRAPETFTTSYELPSSVEMMLLFESQLESRPSKVEDESSPRSFHKEKLGFPETFPHLGVTSGSGFSKSGVSKSPKKEPLPEPIFCPKSYENFPLSYRPYFSQSEDKPHDEPDIAIPIPRIFESRPQPFKPALAPMNLGANRSGQMKPLTRHAESFSGQSQDSFAPIVEEIISKLLDKQPLCRQSVSLLSPSERWLVRALIKKIFNVVLSDPIESLDFVDVANLSRDKGRSKRLEEELKVVFKKTMKFLLTRFKDDFDDQDCSDHPKKFDYVVGFYKRYFESVYALDAKFREFFKITAEDKSLDVKKLNSELIHPLTVNAQHIGLVMKSTLFKNEAIEYIETKLVPDYDKIRELKIKKILKKFYDVVSRDRSKETIDQFIGNSQTKLPWATKDLQHAIKNFMEIIKRSEPNSEASSV